MLGYYADRLIPESRARTPKAEQVSAFSNTR